MHATSAGADPSIMHITTGSSKIHVGLHATSLIFPSYKVVVDVVFGGKIAVGFPFRSKFGA